MIEKRLWKVEEGKKEESCNQRETHALSLTHRDKEREEREDPFFLEWGIYTPSICRPRNHNSDAEFLQKGDTHNLFMFCFHPTSQESCPGFRRGLDDTHTVFIYIESDKLWKEGGMILIYYYDIIITISYIPQDLECQ